MGSRTLCKLCRNIIAVWFWPRKHSSLLVRVREPAMCDTCYTIQMKNQQLPQPCLYRKSYRRRCIKCLQATATHRAGPNECLTYCPACRPTNIVSKRLDVCRRCQTRRATYCHRQDNKHRTCVSCLTLEERGLIFKSMRPHRLPHQRKQCYKQRAILQAILPWLITRIAENTVKPYPLIFQEEWIGSYRPDLLILLSTRVALLLEIDEYAHRHYPVESEVERMMNIWQYHIGLHRTLYVIRFNPDACEPCWPISMFHDYQAWAYRMAVLCTVCESIIKLSSSPTLLSSCIYKLFYFM